MTSAWAGSLSVTNYFVTGLPRSRTAWFAAFLPNCSHEGLKWLEKRSDFDKLMTRYDGLSDSVLMLTDFQQRFPGCKTLIIERPVDEVIESLGVLGFGSEDFVKWCDTRLSAIPGLRVAFNDIDERLPEICHFLGVPYDEQRAELFCRLNIQTNDLSVSEALNLWV